MHILDYYMQWKMASTEQILEEIKKKNELRQQLLEHWSKEDCMEDIKILQRILENRNKTLVIGPWPDVTGFLGEGI